MFRQLTQFSEEMRMEQKQNQLEECKRQAKYSYGASLSCCVYAHIEITGIVASEWKEKNVGQSDGNIESHVGVVFMSRRHMLLNSLSFAGFYFIYLALAVRQALYCISHIEPEWIIIVIQFLLVFCLFFSTRSDQTHEVHTWREGREFGVCVAVTAKKAKEQ